MRVNSPGTRHAAAVLAEKAGKLAIDDNGKMGQLTLPTYSSVLCRYTGSHIGSSEAWT